VNELREQLRQLQQRLRAQFDRLSARERWFLIGAVAVAAFLMVRFVAVTPLAAATERVNSAGEDLENDLQLAARIAPKIRQLRSEIAIVEERIQPGQKTDLFRLLEQLAAKAQMADKLEAVRPKTPSRNELYPETRAEVQLRGTTLAQTVQFLYSIETAPLYLIVRSVDIKARPDETQLLDVSFSVSSFQRKDG